MQIRIKKSNQDGMIRLESSGEVKEIMVNADLFNPEKESIGVAFMGKNSSGIIDFSPQEIEMIYESVRERMHLIKGFKRMRSRAF